MNPDRQFTLKKALKTAVQIVRNNGFTALWRGNTATLLMIAPKSAIAFTMFDRTEEVGTGHMHTMESCLVCAFSCT